MEDVQSGHETSDPNENPGGGSKTMACATLDWCCSQQSRSFGEPTNGLHATGMKPEPRPRFGLIGFCGFFPGFFFLGLSGLGLRFLPGILPLWLGFP
jgi:hypothetical protein